MPSLCNFYSAHYTWKSTNFGADIIILTQKDTRYIPGRYIVGVFSLKASEYRLRYTAKKLPDLLNSGTHKIFLSSVSHFQFPLVHVGQSRIEILATKEVAIFASFNILRPDLTHHDYSVGFSDLPRQCVDIDPFESCPLHYTLPKTQKSRQSPFELPMRLCFETHASANCLGSCYFSIENLSTEPLELYLTCHEIFEHDLIPSDLLPLFQTYEKIFSNSNSSEISQLDRTVLGLNFNCEFTYGETDFLSFGKLLQYCRPLSGEVFWDLGCGAGKSCVAAALFYPDLIVKGVEMLPNLYASSIEATKTIENISIVQGDLRITDWSDANIIFMSSVCFLDELVQDIVTKSSSLKPGSRILTLKELPEPSAWTLQNIFRVRMSWGRCDCFFYIKFA